MVRIRNGQRTRIPQHKAKRKRCCIHTERHKCSTETTGNNESRRTSEQQNTLAATPRAVNAKHNKGSTTHKFKIIDTEAPPTTKPGLHKPNGQHTEKGLQVAQPTRPANIGCRGWDRSIGIGGNRKVGMHTHPAGGPCSEHGGSQWLLTSRAVLWRTQSLC